MEKTLSPIKIFSMEPDEFFKIFIQDALMIYSPREAVLTFSSSVKETLDTLSQHLPEVPDIIFLDLAVLSEPGGKIEMQGGFRVLKVLRSKEAFQKVPIIMLSKYGEKSLQKKAIKLGATRYLVKGECMPRDIAETVACADKIYPNSIKRVFPWVRK